MKKTIIICFVIFFLLDIVFVLLFGNMTIKKNAPMKVYSYKDSPFYKDILKRNDSIIYLNIWANYSPYSIERYQELIKDSTKIVYNLSLNEDSVTIKKGIEKFGLKNDITFDNYNYRKEILKEIYHDRRFSIGFIEVSDYKTPMTFVFEKQILKKDF